MCFSVKWQRPLDLFFGLKGLKISIAQGKAALKGQRPPWVGQRRKTQSVRLQEKFLDCEIFPKFIRFDYQNYK